MILNCFVKKLNPSTMHRLNKKMVENSVSVADFYSVFCVIGILELEEIDD